jgi:hypothetical protein
MRAINYPLSSRVRSSPREIFNLPYSVFLGDCKKKMGLAQIFSATGGCRDRFPGFLRRSRAPDPPCAPLSRGQGNLVPDPAGPLRPVTLSASLPPLRVSCCLAIRSLQPPLHHLPLHNPSSVSPSLHRPGSPGVPGTFSLAECRPPSGEPLLEVRAPFVWQAIWLGSWVSFCLIHR